MRSILFLLRSFGIGGAERQLIVLASELQQRGYSVKIAVFYGGGPLEDDARKKNIQIVDLRRKGRWDLIPFFFRLIDLIKQEKPDILHSYLQVPNIWSALVKLVLPRVKVVWGIRASNVEMKQYGWQAQLTDKAEYLLAKIPDWMICNSQAGKDHAVKKGYPIDKLSVISNGIDTEHFIPNRESGMKLRKGWGIEAHQKLVGTVGRLDPIKDYPNFLRAASLLLQECKDIRFVCVGGGPEKYVQEYAELARSLKLEKHLIWAGEREDMVDIYNALDIFVLSSTSEGLSNAIGESMACGTPCVVTDVGDARLLIGDLGEIVPPRDSDALKRGILTLLNRFESENRNLKDESIKKITDQFSTAKLVVETIETLNRFSSVRIASKRKSTESNLGR